MPVLNLSFTVAFNTEIEVWTSINEALTDNDAGAACPAGVNGKLRLTGGSGGTLPAGAVVEGFLVSIKGKSEFTPRFEDVTYGIDVALAGLADDPTDSRHTDLDVDASGSGGLEWGTETVGSSTDLFGLSGAPDPADINDAAFGVYLWRPTTAEDPTQDQAHAYGVDYVVISIYYSEPGSSTVIAADGTVRYVPGQGVSATVASFRRS